MGITLILATTPEILDHCKRVMLKQFGTLPGYEFSRIEDFINKIIGLKHPHHKLLSRSQQLSLLKKGISELETNAPALKNWNLPGTRAQLLKFISEFRKNGKSFAEIDSSCFHGKEFKEIFSAYEKLLDGRIDSASIYKEFKSIISDKKSWPAYLNQIGKVIFCGFDNPACDPIHADIISVIEKLFTHEKFKQTTKNSKPLKNILTAIENGQPAASKDFPANFELSLYPSAVTEIRNIARRIAAMLAGEKRAGNLIEKAILPEDILIVIPEDNAYKCLLRDELDMYCVPHDIHEPESFANSKVGIFAISMVDILNIEKLEWKHIEWLLSNSLISSGKLQGSIKTKEEHVALLSILDIAGRANLKRADISTWKDAGVVVLHSLENRIKENEKDPEKSGEFLRIKKTLHVYVNLFESLEKILIKSPSCQTLKDHCVSLNKVLNALGLTAKAQVINPGDEDKQLNILKHLLESDLKSAFSSDTMDATEFKEWLSNTMSGIQWNPERISNATPVSVRSCVQTEIASWPYVFAIGVNEKVFPPYASYPDILDTESIEKTGMENLDSQNRRFLRASINALKSASSHLFISYSSDGMDGKRVLPSVIIQNLKDAFPDAKCYKYKTDLVIPCGENVISERDALAANRLSNAESDNTDVAELIEFCEFWKRPDNKKSANYEFGSSGADIVLRPSSLDNFGICPYKYFASTILNLEEKDEPDLEPDIMTTGSCLHRALELHIKDYLENPDFFICDSEEAYTKKREEFSTKLNIRIDAALTSLHGFPSDLLVRIADKWKKTLVSFAKSMFYVKYNDIYLLADKYNEFHTLLKNIRDSIEKKKLNAINTKDKRKIEANENAINAEGLLPGILKGIKVEKISFPGGFILTLPALQDCITTDPYVPFSCEYKVKNGDRPFEMTIRGQIIKISGKIDRIDIAVTTAGKLIRIADYKSANKSKLAELVRDWKKYQVPIYALAVREMTKDASRGFLADAKIAETGTIALKENAALEMLSCDEENLKKFEDMLIAAYSHISTGRLAPAPKAYCPFFNYTGNCDYSALCRGAMISEDKFKIIYPGLSPVAEKE